MPVEPGQHAAVAYGNGTLGQSAALRTQHSPKIAAQSNFPERVGHCWSEGDRLSLERAPTSAEPVMISTQAVMEVCSYLRD